MQTINSKELLRDCYGLARQQKRGSCWLDSTLEVFLNSDTLGELVRSEMFDYGQYNDRIIPYRVNPSIIKNDDYQSFLIYIIFNFILFNLEITSMPNFLSLTNDKIKLTRKDSLMRCEKSLEKFMSIIEKILYEKKTLQTIIKILNSQLKDKPDKKLSKGGYPTDLINLLFEYIPNIDLYVDKKFYEYPEMFSTKLFEPPVFIGASITFQIIKEDERHATSIIKCSDKIFYYDNNAPINIATKKRNIDFSEHIITKGKKIKTGLELFWQNGLGYIKHYCDYFKNPGHFIFKEDMPKKPSELLDGIVIFNRKIDYNKTINIDIINIDIIEGITLKEILIKNYLENINTIINIQFSDQYKDILNKINIAFCNYLNIITEQSEAPVVQLNQEELNYKYLKYKHKYLSLRKQII